MARLRGGQPVPEAERIDAARAAAAAWQQVVVLKGAHTVIAEPGGQVVVCPWATPALATAGSGDVLAGAIGGLLAQGLAPFVAAVLGVHLHALAGQLLERRHGRAGAVASDQPDTLPAAWAALAASASHDPFAPIW
jgi:NAD(P)H-hydrate epimerase